VFSVDASVDEDDVHRESRNVFIEIHDLDLTCPMEVMYG